LERFDATLWSTEVKEQTMSARRVPIALALLFVLFGCASGGAGHAATTPLPVVHASEKQDGGKVSLRPGQKLRIVLHSTYWELKAVSDPTVLRRAGAPIVNPKSGCVPGQGCGTVTVTYVAKAVGSAVVTADRTSCGEAMGCTAAAGSYKLTVVVRAATH
jgi:hypothetical protein